MVVPIYIFSYKLIYNYTLLYTLPVHLANMHATKVNQFRKTRAHNQL